MYSAAGRTDKGAHALGQTISFITDCKVEDIIKAVNNSLYPRILAWAYRLDPHGEFKAREWCVKRIYAYLLTHQFPRSFSEKLRFFEGYGDYSWLVPVCRGRNPRRLVYSTSIIKTPHGFLAVIIGESFLKQQVRRMLSYALGICPALNKCKLLPASNLVLVDSLYSFSFKPIRNALKLLGELASPIPPLASSLTLLSRLLTPAYQPCDQWEEKPAMLHYP